MKNVAIDFVAGTFSSCINAFVGYPLDFIKTRLQIQTTKQGALSSAVSIVKQEGFRALYSGLSAQLVVSVVSGSSYFTTYEFVRRKFANLAHKSEHDYIANYQTFISGSCAQAKGMVSGCISVPFEYAKILSQRDSRLRQGPFRKALKIINNEGFLKLYKGFELQVVRDGIGCGCFFLFHSLTLKYFTPEGKNRNEASQFGVLASSVAAGAGYWMISYPIDIIKTRLQTSSTGLSNIVSELYQEGGLMKFYKGFKITMIRSVLVNIFALQTYEYIRRGAYQHF